MTEKMGAGDLRLEDVLNMDKSKAMNLFRNRFIRYKKLVEELGEVGAYEKLLEKYPEQQKALMGTFIDNDTIADGFRKSIPLLRPMGFITEIVDISQNGVDAALEIQRVCPALSLAKEYGFETPCHVLCEMEQEAARRAFPDMKATLLSRQAVGDCVCVFKYERPARTVAELKQNTPNIFVQIIDILKLVPKLIQAGIKILKTRFSS